MSETFELGQSQARPRSARVRHPEGEVMKCPECVQGKCRNCTGEALDPATDELVPCVCEHP